MKHRKPGSAPAPAAGESGTLNLDALYGLKTKHPISVLWDGTKYRFRLPDELSPVELIEIEQAYKQFKALPAARFLMLETTTAKAKRERNQVIAKMEGALNRLLKVLAPEFAAVQNVNFNAKMSAISFYYREIQSREKTSSKKAGARRR